HWGNLRLSVTPDVVLVIAALIHHPRASRAPFRRACVHHKVAGPLTPCPVFLSLFVLFVPVSRLSLISHYFSSIGNSSDCIDPCHSKSYRRANFLFASYEVPTFIG